jgi:hypothetical protein
MNRTWINKDFLIGEVQKLSSALVLQQAGDLHFRTKTICYLQRNTRLWNEHRKRMLYSRLVHLHRKHQGIC